MKKIIYISGPISGDVENNRCKFNDAAEELTFAGYTVLNPAMLPSGLTELQYMQICQPMLMCADIIYLLPGWKSSKGALAEFALAQKLDIRIVTDIEELF